MGRHRQTTGIGVGVRRATDPWLSEHPPRFQWSVDVVPSEIPRDHPRVTLALSLGETLGRPGKIGALDSWHDAATFTRLGRYAQLLLRPRRNDDSPHRG